MTTKFSTAVAVLVATVLTAGVLAAPANASTGEITEARLTITRDPRPSAWCVVTVSGLASMTQREAEALLTTGHKIVIRLWGEDPFSDDLLMGPWTLAPNPSGLQSPQNQIRATPEGLRFVKQVVQHEVVLDEDPFPEVGDEIYAGIRLVNREGQTIRSRETNRVSGQFFPITRTPNCT